MTPDTERRRERRFRQRVFGVLVLNDDLTRFPIYLVNKSSFGLTIELSEHTELPESFRILLDRTIEPCALVWQVDRLAGLRVLALSDERPG